MLVQPSATSKLDNTDLLYYTFKIMILHTILKLLKLRIRLHKYSLSTQTVTMKELKNTAKIKIPTSQNSHAHTLEYAQCKHTFIPVSTDRQLHYTHPIT